mgnify:CR=1 FL=1
MDNRELERLMDRYRRELIEFSRMNSGKNSVGEEPDEREKRQMIHTFLPPTLVQTAMLPEATQLK